MTPDSARARRRKHRFRIRRRAQRIYPMVADAWKLADTITAVCGCFYCRNPRPLLRGRARLTRQELRATLDALDPGAWW